MRKLRWTVSGRRTRNVIDRPVPSQRPQGTAAAEVSDPVDVGLIRLESLTLRRPVGGKEFDHNDIARAGGNGVRWIDSTAAAAVKEPDIALAIASANLI